jgi:hypothetical protein
MTSKISALPAVSTPAETDQHEVNQGGVSKRETNTQILSLRGLLARFTVSNDTVPASDLINLEFTADYDPQSTLSAVDTFTAPATGWYAFQLGGGSRVNANGAIWADANKVTVTTYINGAGGETLAWLSVVGASTATNIHLPLTGENTLLLTAGDDVIFECENFTASNRAYVGGTLSVLRVA